MWLFGSRPKAKLIESITNDGDILNNLKKVYDDTYARITQINGEIRQLDDDLEKRRFISSELAKDLDELSEAIRTCEKYAFNRSLGNCESPTS